MIFGSPTVGTDLRIPPAMRPGKKMDVPGRGKITLPPGLFGGPPPFATSGIGDQHNREMYGEGHPYANAASYPVQTLDAQQTAPDRWTVEGFDRMRQANPNLPPPSLPQGPLGGSLRQPFDYEAALAKLQGPQRKFGLGKFLVAGLADALNGRSYMVPFLLQQQAAQEGRNQEAAKTLLGYQYRDFARQNEADLRAANPFSSGRDRVAYDPGTGQSRVIYDGPEDFETYARQLGLEPGSDEYYKAVEDYVLRSSGPSAHERDLEADDYRTENDRELENLRYGNRVGLEGLRQRNRQGMISFKNANPAPPRSGKPSRSAGGLITVKTPQEAEKLKPGTQYRTPDGQVFTR